MNRLAEHGWAGYEGGEFRRVKTPPRPQGQKQAPHTLYIVEGGEGLDAGTAGIFDNVLVPLSHPPPPPPSPTHSVC